MSFDKNGCYIGNFEPYTVILKPFKIEIVVPLGYKMFYNIPVQKGDLYFCIISNIWKQYSKNCIGMFSSHVARKIKSVNKIFIDM